MKWFYRRILALILWFRREHYRRKIARMTRAMTFFNDYMDAAGFDRTKKRQTWRELSKGRAAVELANAIDK